MDDHLGRSGCSGAEEHPFGQAALHRHILSSDYLRTATDPCNATSATNVWKLVVRQDRIDPPVSDQCGNMLWRSVRGAENDALSDPVDSGQCQCSSQLISGDEQNRSTSQFSRMTIQVRAG